MKKIRILIILGALIVSTGLAVAQDKKGEMRPMGEKKGMGMMDMMGGGMMDKGMMGGKMMMCQGMMHSMMNKSIVPTGDGGIILLSGNNLSKYDKDLNLVKSVEIKTDMEGMQKMMSQMMENCPMMGKGMKEAADSDQQIGNTQDTKAATDEIDHASHH